MAPDGTDGGTRMIARSLENIAREQGIEIITGARVERILDSGGAVHGLKLEDGRTIKVDAVVSNCDVQRTNRKLLATPAGHKEADRIAKQVRARLRRRRPLPRPRQAVRPPRAPQLPLQLRLAVRVRRHLQQGHPRPRSHALHRRPEPDRSDTGPPRAARRLYILIHTAYKRTGQVWDGEGGLLEQYRPVIIDKLKKHGMADIEDHIKVEHSLTPDGIDRMYNAEGGAIYGLASHGRLGGGFKPRNRSKALNGLYLAGGSVNPGPGMPMVLMSGVTAAHALFEDFGMDVPRPADRRGVRGRQKGRGRVSRSQTRARPAGVSPAVSKGNASASVIPGAYDPKIGRVFRIIARRMIGKNFNALRMTKGSLDRFAAAGEHDGPDRCLHVPRRLVGSDVCAAHAHRAMAHQRRRARRHRADRQGRAQKRRHLQEARALRHRSG
jgi:hypothetical protein